MEITRENAIALLEEYVKSDSLKKHCFAVGAAMDAYSEKFNQDPKVWGACGILHDFDYEKYPDQHPFKGVEILKGKGYPQDFIDAILGHAIYSGVERASDMAKCLFAVDELCGFIVACSLVRPDGFLGMEPKSVKKKLKIKSFAAQINRDEIAQGIKEIGVAEDEHIAFVISALSKAKEEGVI